MAHFAKLDENNKVLAVHCVVNEALDSNDEELSGVTFLTQLHNHSMWKQTSYNGKIRFNYAGEGMFYDEVRNAFIAPKPFNSWVLDEATCRWNSPIAYPQDKKMYGWNEESLSWVELG